jgi:hypothetical protein
MSFPKFSKAIYLSSSMSKLSRRALTRPFTSNVCKGKNQMLKSKEMNFRAAEPRGIKRKDSVDLNRLLHLDF